MYVQKFEGDTLEQALREVKAQLGPDAIILKTVNNKGLKGAFRKKKFEITAAISENNYIQKAKVDRVLSREQKQKFYNSDAGHVSQMIKKYNREENMQNQGSGYGELGLNKVVNTISSSTSKIKKAASETSTKIKSGLDEFLTAADDFTPEETDTVENFDQFIEEDSFNADLPVSEPQRLDHQSHSRQEMNLPRSQREALLESRLKLQQQKIDDLEEKLFEIAKNMNTTEVPEESYSGLSTLRTTLKTLDLDEVIIQRIIKKANFELSNEEQNDQDIIFEFALREINSLINVDMPLFSKQECASDSVITVFVSEVATGQSSMVYKLASMCEDSLVVELSSQPSKASFTQSMLGIEVVSANSIPELVGVLRKADMDKKKVFVDFKNVDKNSDQTKSFIDTIKRSFKNVEVLVSISAIHTELYNRKIISKYQDFTNGVIISHIDLCLNFGALVNVHHANDELPLKFFGTGTVVPEDFEAATSERILAGMFQF